MNQTHMNIQRGTIIGIVFLVGTIFGQWLNAPVENASQTEYDSVLNKLDALSMVCAKPVPKGEVVISSADIINAARGKSLEFIAEVR